MQPHRLLLANWNGMHIASSANAMTIYIQLHAQCCIDLYTGMAAAWQQCLPARNNDGRCHTRAYPTAWVFDGIGLR